MKAHLNEKQENRNMRKSMGIKGLTVFILVAMVFLSGCVSQNQTSSTSPQTVTMITPLATPQPVVTTTTNPKIVATIRPQVAITPRSNTRMPPSESLIQPADVPQLTFSSFGYTSTYSNPYNYSVKNIYIRSSSTRGEIVSTYREVGQSSNWVSLDQSALIFQQIMFDTSEGNGADLPAKINSCADEIRSGTYVDCGSAGVGDVSFYGTSSWSGGLEITTLSFAQGKNFVFMSYQDKAGTGKSEAIRIAQTASRGLK